MGLNRMPGKRPGRHAFVTAGLDRAADQPTLVDPAVASVADLLMAGEVSSVCGAAMVVPPNCLLRATTQAGNEGVAGAPTSAVTGYGAAIHGPVLMTRRDSPRDRGDRP